MQTMQTMQMWVGQTPGTLLHQLSHTDALTPPDDMEEGPSAEELVQRYMERVTSQCLTHFH